MFKSLCLLLIALLPMSAFAVDLPQRPFVHVTGEAELKVKPEIANLAFTLRRSSRDYNEGYQKIQTQTGQLLQFLKSQKVETEDIESYNIQVRRNMDYQSGTLRSYDFTRFFKVKLNNLSAINAFYDGLYKLQIGDNISTDFDVKNRKQREEELRTQALENAKIQAEQLSKPLGNKVIGVYAISQGGIAKISNTFIPNKEVYEGQTFQQSRVAMESDLGGPGGGFLIPNQITLSSQINVIFYIEPSDS